MHYKPGRIFLFFLSLILILSVNLRSQHKIGISLKFNQIQEALNNGMVFDGPEFSINYGFLKLDKNSALNYSAGLSVGVLFNRGIMGINLTIKPADIYYGFRINDSEDFKMYLGPRLFTSYNLQLYPDLQSGLDFWITNFNLAPNLLIEFPHEENLVRINGSISVFGVISRTPENRNPYWFSLKFTDFVSDLHSDFQAGSFNKFIHSTLELEYLLGNSRIWSFGYGFDYFEYFQKPSIKMLNHKLNIKYNFGV